MAESKKLIPASRAESMMENEVGSSVSGPKFMVPRQMRLTVRPVRPRWVNCMGPNLPGRDQGCVALQECTDWPTFSPPRYIENTISHLSEGA